jgi:hypothetical protein
MFEKNVFYDLMLHVPIASSSLSNSLEPVNNRQNYHGKPPTWLCLHRFLCYHIPLSLSSSLPTCSHRQSPQLKKAKFFTGLTIEVRKSVESKKNFFSIFFNIQETKKEISTKPPRCRLNLVKQKFRNNHGIVCLVLLITTLNYGRFANSGEPAEKMKGGRGEGWKGGTSGLVKVGRMLFRMKFESIYEIICLFLLFIFNLSTNSGEPASVFGFKNQKMFGFSLPPKSAAAGLLFCWLMGKRGDKDEG